MTTMTDLLLPRGSTKNKEQVQKLLESQPAVKKDRAGSLPGRGVVSRLGCRAGSKTGWGAGGGVRPEDLETPKTQLYQHASHFFAFCLHFLLFFFNICFLHFFLHFPDWESFFGHVFCISQTGSHFFAFFLHFLDRVCHLHRLPDPDEKTTRTCRVFGLSSSAPDQATRAGWENDKKMTNKWHQNDNKMAEKWPKNDKQMTPQNRNDKKMIKPNDKKRPKNNKNKYSTTLRVCW